MHGLLPGIGHRMDSGFLLALFFINSREKIIQLKLSKAGMCNHAELPDQMHINQIGPRAIAACVKLCWLNNSLAQAHSQVLRFGGKHIFLEKQYFCFYMF